MTKKLIFFGNERLVSGLKHTNTPILRRLIQANYNIVAVVASHTDGASRKNRQLEIQELANEHNIPVLLPNKPLDIFDKLVKLDADAAILVAYGRIIPKKIIDLFPKGIINLHPSLLPKYRGSTPIESAILNGDNTTGVSIMKLSEEMDAGPVYSQSTVDILPNDTKFSLYDKLVDSGTDLLLQVLPSILDGSIAPKSQDIAGGSYSRLLSKTDGRLDTIMHTASQAERRVRAHLGFPQSHIELSHGVNVIITSAHVSDYPEQLSVKFSDGKYLSIDSLKPIGKKEMPVKAFLAGYKDKL
jgi:methionyl-tRNA formyltransferase